MNTLGINVGDRYISCDTGVVVTVVDADVETETITYETVIENSTLKIGSCITIRQFSTEYEPLMNNQRTKNLLRQRRIKRRFKAFYDDFS